MPGGQSRRTRRAGALAAGAARGGRALKSGLGRGGTAASTAGDRDWRANQ